MNRFQDFLHETPGSRQIKEEESCLCSSQIYGYLSGLCAQDQRTSGVCAWEGDMLAEVTLASNPGTGRKAKDIGRAWGKMKRGDQKDNEERNEDFRVKENNRR